MVELLSSNAIQPYWVTIHDLCSAVCQAGVNKNNFEVGVACLREHRDQTVANVECFILGGNQNRRLNHLVSVLHVATSSASAFREKSISAKFYVGFSVRSPSSASTRCGRFRSPFLIIAHPCEYTTRPGLLVPIF